MADFCGPGERKLGKNNIFLEYSSPERDNSFMGCHKLPVSSLVCDNCCVVPAVCVGRFCFHNCREFRSISYLTTFLPPDYELPFHHV